MRKADKIITNTNLPTLLDPCKKFMIHRCVNMFIRAHSVVSVQVCPRFTKDVTHVVFKDGKPSARERAEKNRVFLVSPLWVEA